MALALLGLGEAAPAAFPVNVTIEGHGASLLVTVDGQEHAVSAAVGPGWRGISLQQPGPLDREYQIDGSDTTSTDDRNRELIGNLLASPLYRFDAWLRDESSYSRWEHLQLVDLATGQAAESASPLPSDFRLEVGLRRPEAAARIWLVGPDGADREGLELDGDRRNARWVIQHAGNAQVLPRWFFPEQAAPFAAELLNLVGRSAAAAYALVLATLLAAAVVRHFLARLPHSAPGAPRRTLRSTTASVGSAPGARARGAARGSVSRGADDEAAGRPASAAAVVGGAQGADPARRAPYPSGIRGGPPGAEALARWWLRARATAAVASAVRGAGAWVGAEGAVAAGRVVLPLWLLAAALVAARLYHQLPHILDAMSYTFEASLFVSGRIALDAGPLAANLRGPFEVLSEGQLFSQYPPGAPAAFALGQLVSLEWLVGPMACLAMLAATRWTASILFGPACGLAVVCLGALSPFVLFQAGSFLSHPIAGGLLACALAAFVAGEREGAWRWYAMSAVLLGASFLTREAASVLFALPLGARLVSTRRWKPLLCMIGCGLPLVGLYLLYNAQLTGSAFLLPRTIFNASDHFGFGDGIGFHTRHTLAAGLANTDELLTLLQFELFGWPPLFALGLLGLPFLLARARAWDVLAAIGLLSFVIAYATYFYHGIALGPRYYFEAMPWLLLLGGRGVQILARLAGSRAAVGLLLGILSLNALVFYLPSEIQRREDFSGMPGNRKVTLAFVQTSVWGPQLVGLPNATLVVTDDWWLYNAALAALNCPRMPDCGVLFALASTPADLQVLRAHFPHRDVLRTVDRSGRVELMPDAP